MADVIQKDSTLSVLQDIRARLTKLESNPPGAMELLSSDNSGVLNTVYTPSNVPADMPVTRSTSFTLLRPQCVLVFGSLVYFTSGGTGSYGYGYMIVETPGTTVVAQSARVAHSQGSGKSDVSRMWSGVLPAGTYSAVWQSFIDIAGSGTTLTMESSQFDIFLLAS